jgi:hypothetical protein
MRLFSGAAFVGLAFLGVSTSRTAVDDPPFSTALVSVPDTNIAPEGLPELEAVEVGHHDAFDRIVFRFSSRAPGYDVNYVPQVRADPSDEPIPLEGNAFMIVAMNSVASAQVEAPDAPQDRQTPRFPELREIAGAGDFEGVVSFGLGLTAESGFRVFTLTNPDRLVVDVRVVTLAATGSTTRPMILTASMLVLVGAVGAFVARRSWRSTR